MSGKVKVDFKGLDSLIEDLKKADIDFEKAIVKSIVESTKKPKEDMLNYMAKHRRTGRTERSFEENTVIKNGVIYHELGFNASKGGLPAIFLNLGTPRIQPSFFIDNAFENNLDYIINTQNETLEKILKGALDV